MLRFDELEKALAQPYSGPTFTRPGANGKDLTYIPWEVTMAQFDQLFGASNWDHKVTSVQINPKEGLYVVAVEITVRYLDHDGLVAAITRGGVGRAAAEASVRKGETVNYMHHDLAAAAAESDAFSRAAKKFGPALGSDLIGGNKKPSGNGASNGNGGAKTASADKPVSESQLNVIRKAGTPENVIAGLKNAAEASKLIEEIKANGWKYPGGGVQTPDDLDDDF